MVSSVSAIEFTARTGVANTNFDYTFNFTTDAACSNVLLSYTDDVTTDSNGDYFFSIPSNSLTSIPSYLCEYKDDALRKVHNYSDIIFNSIRVNEIYTNNISSNDWTNITLTESQIADLQNYLLLSGGTMTGNLNMNNNNITNPNNMRLSGNNPFIRLVGEQPGERSKLQFYNGTQTMLSIECHGLNDPTHQGTPERHCGIYGSNSTGSTKKIFNIDWGNEVNNITLGNGDFGRSALDINNAPIYNANFSGFQQTDFHQFKLAPIHTIQDSDTSINTAQATLRLAESGASQTLGSYWDIQGGFDDFDFSIESDLGRYLTIDRLTGDVEISPGNLNMTGGNITDINVVNTSTFQTNYILPKAGLFGQQIFLDEDQNPYISVATNGVTYAYDPSDVSLTKLTMQENYALLNVGYNIIYSNGISMNATRTTLTGEAFFDEKIVSNDRIETVDTSTGDGATIASSNLFGDWFSISLDGDGDGNGWGSFVTGNGDYFSWTTNMAQYQTPNLNNQYITHSELAGDSTIGSNQEISRFRFGGVDSAIRYGAYIKVFSDGAWNTNNINDAPARIEFITQCDGTGDCSGTPSMVIDSNQDVIIYNNLEIGNGGVIINESGGDLFVGADNTTFYGDVVAENFIDLSWHYNDSLGPVSELFQDNITKDADLHEFERELVHLPNYSRPIYEDYTYLKCDPIVEEGNDITKPIGINPLTNETIYEQMNFTFENDCYNTTIQRIVDYETDLVWGRDMSVALGKFERGFADIYNVVTPIETSEGDVLEIDSTIIHELHMASEGFKNERNLTDEELLDEVRISHYNEDGEFNHSTYGEASEVKVVNESVRTRDGSIEYVETEVPTVNVFKYVGKIESTVEILTRRMRQLFTRTEALETQVAQQQLQIENLQQRLNRLEGGR